MGCGSEELGAFFHGGGDIWRCRHVGVQIRRGINPNNYEETIFYVERVLGTEKESGKIAKPVACKTPEYASELLKVICPCFALLPVGGVTMPCMKKGEAK